MKTTFHQMLVSIPDRGFRGRVGQAALSPESDFNQGEVHTSGDSDVESDGFTDASAAHKPGSPRRQRTWPEKFRDAFRGVGLGVWGQNSFLVHGFFTVAAIISGLIFQISLWEWLIVGLCVVIVWTAEMFNSALERLARAINQKYDPNIRDALDIGSGAVLTAAIGAATVGGCLFLYHLLRVLGIL